MWSTPLALLPSLLTGVSALVLPPAIPSSAINQPRDVLGLLGGGFDTSFLPLPTRPVIPLSKGLTKTSIGPSGEPIAPASRTGTNQPTAGITDSANPANRTPYPHSSTIETTVPSQSPILAVSAATQTSGHISKTWQVVGIVFISILLIATFITCAMFFDRLWRFFKDVFCGKSRSETSEEFIPDLESHSWDVTTPSPSLADITIQRKSEPLIENLSANTRELPWNSDSQTWNTLHRQPSRGKDHHIDA